MVAYLGMSEKLYNLCYYNNQEYQFEKPYSEKTAETIDSEVAALVARQYERAKQLLKDHQSGHAKLASVLEEREVIFAKDVEEIFGKRPWRSRADELLQDEQEKSSEDNISEKPLKDDDIPQTEESLEGKDGEEVK